MGKVSQALKEGKELDKDQVMKNFREAHQMLQEIFGE